MTTFWEIMTSAQAIFAMLLIVGLLIYIAFYKDSIHSRKK